LHASAAPASEVASAPGVVVVESSPVAPESVIEPPESVGLVVESSPPDVDESVVPVVWFVGLPEPLLPQEAEASAAANASAKVETV